MNAELLKTISFALYKHGKQKRNARNQAFVPYMVHPIEVATILMECGIKDEHTLKVAILHDVLEDTDCTEKEMRMMFGREVTQDVKILTVPNDIEGPKEKKEYQKRSMIGNGISVCVVKVADKTSNLRDMVRIPPDWKPESFRGYVASALEVVEAADTGGHIPAPLLREFWQAYTELQSWIEEKL